MTMLHLREMATGGPAGTIAGAVTLTFDERRRSRLLTNLDDGREAALLLPRGTILRQGDLLRADEDGAIVIVRAASETLSIARTGDPHLLLRGAYHLGNRHVPVEIGPGWLAYEHDHVLGDMVRGLGLEVDTKKAPFEPEAGAFRHEGSGHAHGHGHGHGHSHEHGDGDGHEHAHEHADGAEGGSHRQS